MALSWFGNTQAFSERWSLAVPLNCCKEPTQPMLRRPIIGLRAKGGNPASDWSCPCLLVIQIFLWMMLTELWPSGLSCHGEKQESICYPPLIKRISQIQADWTQFLIGLKSDNYSAVHKIPFNLLNRISKIGLLWSMAKYLSHLSERKVCWVECWIPLAQQLRNEVALDHKAPVWNESDAYICPQSVKDINEKCM